MRTFIWGFITGAVSTSVLLAMFWGKFKAYILKQEEMLRGKLGGRP